MDMLNQKLTERNNFLKETFIKVYKDRLIKDSPAIAP